MTASARLPHFGALALLLLLPLFASAAPDVRMQVDVKAEEQDVDVDWLHANIARAADMALPQLWNRIVPQHAIGQIPPHVKAVRFLQKAVPNAQGVSILFNEKRVLRYLQQHNIPYYAEQSTAQTRDSAVSGAAAQAQIASPSAMPFQASSPLLPQQEGQLPVGSQNGAQAPLITGLLILRRHASLPEQALFEEDLARDPHVLSLTLRQVSRNEQQYRLQMKGPNDLWLQAWFQRRGLTLTASVDGWVVQQQAAR